MSQFIPTNEEAFEALEAFRRHAEGETPRDDDAPRLAGSAHRLIRDSELRDIQIALSSAVNALHIYARQNPEVRAAQDQINRAQNIVGKVAFLETRWLPPECEAQLEPESNIV